MPSQAADVQISESTTPWPPRNRWLKRSLLIFGIVMALLICTHLWWNHIADHRLAAQIAAIHARGEPILPEDFPIIVIHDADNGAWYLRQAAASIQHGPEATTLWNGWNIKYTDHELSDLTRWMDDEQMARSTARQARAHPTVAWNMKFITPAINTLLPDLNTQRGLAQLLGTVVYVEHRRGNDAEALQAIRDLHFVADAMQQYLPFDVTHLVGIGIDALASDTAVIISPELVIVDDSAQAPVGVKPARRSQVLQLIADLSDERQFQLGGIHSLYGKRLMVLDETDGMPGLMTPNPVGWVLRPAFKLDAIGIVKFETQVSQAMAQPTWAAARAMIPNPRPKLGLTGLGMVTHFLSFMMLPSFGRFALSHFRGLTDRRAAVIALAIRLWQFDHAGKWPASLQDLIPKYLATVPIDPMSPTAAPFQFKPNATGGAIIYSVGDCGVDHGGSEQLIRKISPGFAPGQWDMLNAVYHLTPQPPTTRPSSQ